MRSEYAHLAEELRREIDEHLASIGILFRVFARGKEVQSLKYKINKEPGKYTVGGKLIQDAIGIRIALYFQEDISIVKSVLEKKYKINHKSSTIDKPQNDTFSVTRYNLVFELPSEISENFTRIKGQQPIDNTFEIQLRSILSEGWHEVEHDLRYKSKDNWINHDDLSRTLNSIVATLETSEWTMAKIFEDLAYRHYKSGNWNGMLPSLLKMRIKDEMSKQITDVFNNEPRVAKDLLKIDRSSLLLRLSSSKPKIPVSADNIVFIWNLTGPRNPALLSVTPRLLTDIFTE